MRFRWYGWKSSFDMLPWGYWTSVDWIVLGPLVIELGDNVSTFDPTAPEYDPSETERTWL